MTAFTQCAKAVCGLHPASFPEERPMEKMTGNWKFQADRQVSDCYWVGEGVWVCMGVQERCRVGSREDAASKQVCKSARARIRCVRVWHRLVCVREHKRDCRTGRVWGRERCCIGWWSTKGDIHIGESAQGSKSM